MQHTRIQHIRIQGIKDCSDRNTIKPKLTRLFNVENNDLRLCSLAPDPYTKGQLAAVIWVSGPHSYNERHELSLIGPVRFHKENDSPDCPCTSYFISLDTKFQGFTPLGTYTREDPYSLDVIAVSGLGSHAIGSYYDRVTDYLWLNEGLPKDLPGCRVWTYGWESPLLNSTSSQDMEGYASYFKVHLQRLWKSSRRPLLFIGHSVGGLLIKDALVRLCRGDNDGMDIINMITGAVMLGVPNLGMNIEPLLPLVTGQPNEALVRSLQRGSRYLSDLMHSCQESIPKSIRLFSFYETEPSITPLKDGASAWMSGPLLILVEKDSATAGRVEDRFSHSSLGRNHSTIIKFSRHDCDYVVVLEKLQELSLKIEALEKRIIDFSEPKQGSVESQTDRLGLLIGFRFHSHPSTQNSFRIRYNPANYASSYDHPGCRASSFTATSVAKKARSFVQYQGSQLNIQQHHGQ